MVVIVGVIFKWCKTMVRKKTEFLAIGVTFRSASDLVCSNEIMGDTFSNTRLQVTEKEM